MVKRLEMVIVLMGLIVLVSTGAWAESIPFEPVLTEEVQFGSYLADFGFDKNQVFFPETTLFDNQEQLGPVSDPGPGEPGPQPHSRPEPGPGPRPRGDGEFLMMTMGLLFMIVILQGI